MQAVKSNTLKQDHEIAVFNIVTDYPIIYSGTQLTQNLITKPASLLEYPQIHYLIVAKLRFWFFQDMICLNDMGLCGEIDYAVVLRQIAWLVTNLKIISVELSQNYLLNMRRW